MSGLDEDVRERIIKASMKVFSVHGFFKAPVSLIAKEAGVSKGLVFWYFRSKDELILEVASRSLPTDVIQDCLNQGGKGRELLRCIGEKYLRKYSNPIYRNLLNHTMASETVYPQIKNAVRRLCREHLRRVATVVYGEDSVRARVAMRTFFGSLQCYTLMTPKDIGREEYLDEVIDLLSPEKIKRV